MALLSKPAMPDGSLLLQDDHFRRINDLSFRHLLGAWENHQSQTQHDWIIGISNDDPTYGNDKYLKSSEALNFCRSEEYSQSIASTIFTHVWLLSAANYYRLAIKLKSKSDEDLHNKAPIERVHSPEVIAAELELCCRLKRLAHDLHNARNTIVHLVEDEKDRFPLDDLGFEQAYQFAEGAWEIYNALLEHYGRKPDDDNWRIQTGRYNLPNSLADVTSI